jgi:hypothetical protein
VVELRWIDGAASDVVLNAPKGMAFVGDALHVSDISVLRSFDRTTGKPLGKIAILGSSFLNDVAAAADGTLYVSDTGFDRKPDGSLSPNGKDAIYAVDTRGVVSVLAQGKQLGQPNGLLADAEGVWVVNLAGELFHLSRAGERTASARLPGGGLDGLIRTGSGRLVVSCWETSSVYIGPPPSASAGDFETLIGDLTTPADLGYDPGRSALLVPLFRDHALYVQEVPGG